MSIQRQVRAVNGEVVLDQAAHQLVAFPGPRVGGPPEKPVMHQQQVRLGRRRQPDGRQARVHRRGDPGHRAAILDLQAVGGPVVILHLGRAQQPVAVADNRRQGDS